MAHRYDKPLRDLARIAGKKLFPCNTPERPEIVSLAQQVGQEFDRETAAGPSGSGVLVEYRKRPSKA